MRKLYSLLFIPAVFTSLVSVCQPANDTINKEHVEKTITYLASDRLRGRVNYSKEQLEVTEFIANEFTSYGLELFPGFESFYQPFRTYSGKLSVVDVKWNDRKMSDDAYYFFSRSLIVPSLTLSDFMILRGSPPLADSILYYNWNKSENILLQLVLDDTTTLSEVISSIKIPAGMPSSNILILAEEEEPFALKVSPNKNFSNSVLYNVIGMIPGRTLPDEAIIFCAHYDHISTGRKGETGPIFNGANDNASGTTAVLELARYYAMRKDNDRTIVFCLFAGEELGLLGSAAFIKYIKPENIKAVINIEMIGMTNVGNKNEFMLLGSEYSNLYKIMKKNLEGADVKILRHRSDPENMFGRSDNYSFAKEGIPAHTITSSDDDEPCYHEPCDDVERINMESMTRFIKAIVLGAATLISGKDTPTRITGF